MKKILVIDDQPEVLELLGDLLKHNKYEVLTATEGVEGLAKAQSHKPDLIILDIAMPVMDGYDFMKELRTDDELKNVPVIIITGRVQLKEIFEEQGIHDYIMKPFDKKELLTKVKKLIKT
jgi:CheY-like chemotaxis protein